METKEIQQHIEINPTILMGKAVVRGTRIPVYLILNLIAHGYTFARVREAYPQLTEADIEAALAYAEGLTRYEEGVMVPQLAFA